MNINYAEYFHGELWPSESKTTHVDEPTTMWVGDMAPQYAASALFKMVRWVRERYPDVESVHRAEVEARNSRLGQVLSARALSIDDFTVTEYAPVPASVHLSAVVLARALARELLKVEFTDFDPSQVGNLAMQVASGIYDKGYSLVESS